MKKYCFFWYFDIGSMEFDIFFRILPLGWFFYFPWLFQSNDWSLYDSFYNNQIITETIQEYQPRKYL